MKSLLRKNKNLETTSHIQSVKVKENIITEELIQENEDKIIITAKSIIPKDNVRAMKAVNRKREKGQSILGEELKRIYEYQKFD
ncbi:MAG: hypothetical protein IJO61_05105 [Oscillospiraceae bacterium]|nr:hypothetical protein [Oscillospiraceae bacterium]